MRAHSGVRTSTRPTARALTLSLALVLTAALAAARPAAATAAPASEPTTAPLRSLTFEPNLGQTDPEVRFLARGSGYALFFTPREVVMVLREVAAEPAAPSHLAPPRAPARLTARSQVLRLAARGASPAPVVTGQEPLSGASSYFALDGSRALAEVPHFGRVRYQGIYPGIDQVFYGVEGRLEYDFVVSPGADPGRIEVAFQGAEALELDGQGRLLVHTSLGTVVQPPPVLYQEVAGERRPVAGGYRLTAGEPAGVAFQVAAYDPSLPLVIDPQVVYKNCFGGSDHDWGRALTVTDNGQVYVAGTTYSTDFPTTAGTVQPWDADPGTPSDPGVDVFVAKLNLSGQLERATYLGLDGDDQATSIGLDASRNVYVGGYTEQSNSTPSSVLWDAYVLKLDSTLSTLYWSKIFGGSANEWVVDLAVNDGGDTFATGTTYSSNFCSSGFISGCTLDSSLGGGQDAFAIKINRHGALRYATLLGGSIKDAAQGVALDGSDRAHVTGVTYDTQIGRIWVRRIDASGTRQEYYRELTGNGLPYGITVDDLGQAYVVGTTADPGFYTTPGVVKRQLTGLNDPFVTVLRSNGTCCVYSTLLGDSRYEMMSGIAVDFRRHAYVVGTTYTMDPANPGVVDWYSGQVLVSRLNATGSQILSQIVFGGSSLDSGQDVALDSATNTYVVGITSSSNFQPGNGACNAAGVDNDQTFVSKLQM